MFCIPKNRLILALAFSLLPLTVINSNADSTIPVDATVSEDTPKWTGQAPAHIDALVEKLGNLTDAFPETFGGVALSYDRQSVIVSVADASFRQIAPAVAKIIDANSKDVQVTMVPYSHAELTAGLESTVEQIGDDAVVSAWINVMDNTVRISTAPGQTAEHALRMARQSLPDPSMVVIDTVNPAQDLTGRQNDYPRFFMGGSIRGSQKEICSLGIPVRLGNVRGALTAGHCTSARFTTPKGSFVGNQYTTSYPGNAKLYGDWKIIRGSTYGPKVFSTSATSASNEHHNIVGITKRRTGQEVCHSGQTTGQVCRFVVEGTDSYLTVNGIKSTHQTLLYHDSDRNGISDCNGSQGGDSGGPVFSNAGSTGNVNAHGIVKGTYRTPLNRCRYTYTQFDGVTAWDPGVRLDK